MEENVTKGKAMHAKKNDRKMWVQIKATSDSIEIELDKNRPTSFASKEAELEWDRASAKKALRFIDLVESGQYVPPEIVRKIEEKSI